MRASLSIFPLSGYVLESIRGTVTAADLFAFARRRQRDPRILAHYYSLTDYTQAKLHLSAAEIQQLTSMLYDPSNANDQRHALVVNGARGYVFATMFQAHTARVGIESRCFGHRDAALSWLLAQSKLQPALHAAWEASATR